jgi:hypothetical protein
MSDHNWDEDLTDHKSDQELRQRIGRRSAYLWYYGANATGC